ncbi:MAG: hypothetical protein VB042_10480 [Victivallaceae bacterium]|nr:hypothetical protein [Victivallaceae bacterium]
MPKEDFVLDITHIGESFVAQLLRREEGKKAFLDLCAEQDFDYKVDMVDYNVPVTVDDKSGDEKSEIDIALISGNTCTAVELKLGNSIVMPGQYCARYLSKPYDGSGDKFKGNMISILARYPSMIDIKLRNSQADKCITVNFPWILIVRDEDVRQNLIGKTSLGAENKTKWDCMISHCTIISLQELLKSIDRKKIDEMIDNCIRPKNNDYLDSWHLIDR